TSNQPRKSIELQVSLLRQPERLVSDIDSRLIFLCRSDLRFERGREKSVQRLGDQEVGGDSASLSAERKIKRPSLSEIRIGEKPGLNQIGLSNWQRLSRSDEREIV